MKNIIQELVNGTKHSDSSSITLIISGKGIRDAVSFEHSADMAPLLYIDYTTDETQVITSSKKPGSTGINQKTTGKEKQNSSILSEETLELYQ